MNLIVTKQYESFATKVPRYCLYILFILYLPLAVWVGWNLFTSQYNSFCEFLIFKIIGFWMIVANLLIGPFYLLQKILKELNLTSHNS